MDAADPTPHTLPSDSHYVLVPAGYASPEACLANDPQPFSCSYSLSLCKTGRVGERVGDLVNEGAYTMADSVAHITFDDGDTMAFDVQAVADLDAPWTNWIVDTQGRWDTLQFDNIDCSRP